MEEQILAVQRMQDYINAHYMEEITLADLAEASMFSPWHSHRLFKEYTNQSPAAYIRKLKLSKSAQELKNSSRKIIDVANELNFGSPDGYTRAFHKEFGCNPKEYAENPSPIPLFVPYGVKFARLRKEENNMEECKNVFVQLIDKPERRVVIKRAETATDYFKYCSEVGCDVWGTLLSMCSKGGEPVCLWLTERYKLPNTSTYVQGIECSTTQEIQIPAGFDMITLPACKYLMFQGEPFREEDYCEAIVDVQRSAKKYNPGILGYKWDDENPRIQLEPLGERGYIELYPVKSID